jgi:hypothetical protein
MMPMLRNIPMNIHDSLHRVRSPETTPLSFILGSTATERSGNVAAMASKAAVGMAMRITEGVSPYPA